MASSAKKVREAVASVSIAKAKAGFSSLIHEVEQKRKPVTILRRGIPVAQVIPFTGVEPVPFIGSMMGTATILGDIVSPSLEEWTVNHDWITDPDFNAE